MWKKLDGQGSLVRNWRHSLCYARPRAGRLHLDFSVLYKQETSHFHCRLMLCGTLQPRGDQANRSARSFIELLSVKLKKIIIKKKKKDATKPKITFVAQTFLIMVEQTAVACVVELLHHLYTVLFISLWNSLFVMIVQSDGMFRSVAFIPTVRVFKRCACSVI